MLRVECIAIGTFALLALTDCANTNSAAPVASSVTRAQIAEARKAGYRVVVTRSGSMLLCKNSTPTGSHMIKEECHTADEWNDIQSKATEQVRDSLHNRATPGASVGN